MSATTSSRFSDYDWNDANLINGFDTFDAEVKHMEALGYQLVAPEYCIPPWSKAMQREGRMPRLFLLRSSQPDPGTTHFDCYAARLGYPVYFRKDDPYLPES